MTTPASFSRDARPLIRVRPYVPTDAPFVLQLAPRLVIGIPAWRGFSAHAGDRSRLAHQEYGPLWWGNDGLSGERRPGGGSGAWRPCRITSILRVRGKLTLESSQ